MSAVLDDGDIEKLHKLGIAYTEGHIELVIGVGCALKAGKAAGKAVGGDGPLKGVAQVTACDGSTVVEGVAVVDGEYPAFEVL